MKTPSGFAVCGFDKKFALGSSINDVSSEGEEGGGAPNPMEGDKSRYLVLGKADVVYELTKIFKSR